MGDGSLGVRGVDISCASRCAVFLGLRVLLLLGLRFAPRAPARPTPQSKKEALGKATSAWGVGKLGAWESGERGVASSCASLCCVLGLRVRLPLGLRFAPRAPDTAIKKEALGEATSVCRGGGR